MDVMSLAVFFHVADSVQNTTDYTTMTTSIPPYERAADLQ